MAKSDDSSRCSWASEEPLRSYHDREWAVPVHDDRAHFELVTLEGAQSGLSWLTILRRREHYREAFCGFDPEKVAAFGADTIDRLMSNTGLIRHRLKLESTVQNARALVRLAERFGSFDHFVWQFVGGSPLVNRFASPEQVPASTPLSKQLATTLRHHGFGFLGPTTTYSYLQAAGLVMDHLTSCFRWKDLG